MLHLTSQMLRKTLRPEPACQLPKEKPQSITLWGFFVWRGYLK